MNRFAFRLFRGIVGVALFSSGAVAALAEANSGGGAPAAAANRDAGGKWQLSLDTAADGTRVITASLAADAAIKSGFGETTPVLVLRYRGGRTLAYVAFDTFLGEGQLEVDARFGDLPVERQKWKISSDGRSAFVPGDALAFIERLKRADAFAVSATPVHHDRVVVPFSTSGVDVVVKALISAGVKYTQ